MRQKKARRRAVALPAGSKLATTEKVTATGQQTAKRAAEILCALDLGYVVPTQKQRSALLVAFALQNQVVYGKAFDIIRCPRDLDLDDAAAITAGEMLTAQSLGEQYRFVFVNTLTRKYRERSVRQIFARARGIYPTWSIRL